MRGFPVPVCQENPVGSLLPPCGSSARHRVLCRPPFGSRLDSWSVLGPELQTAEPLRTVFRQVLDPQSSPLQPGDAQGEASSRC